MVISSIEITFKIIQEASTLYCPSPNTLKGKMLKGTHIATVQVGTCTIVSGKIE